MPLKKSPTKKARQENIEEMIDAGHPPRQAVAASYENQRRVKEKQRKKKK